MTQTAAAESGGREWVVLVHDLIYWFVVQISFLYPLYLLGVASKEAN